MANQQPSQEQLQEMARQNARFMARVWSDPAFKRRLVDDPKAVLREQGATIPDDVEISVVENTDKHFYMVLPPKPSEEVSDEQLEAVAGGQNVSMGTVASAGTFGTIGSATGTVGSVGTIGTSSTVGSART